MIARATQTPELGGGFSSFTINTPQLAADVDRDRAKSQGVPLKNVFETRRIYLGSPYVNDLIRFGRTYQVVAQADAEFRGRADAITQVKARNAAEQMIALGTLVKVRETYGPDRVMRYNGYPAAEMLPKGMAIEWAGLTYRKIVAGNTGPYIFPPCILLVFLVLAAQYESSRLPLAVILIVPMVLLSAIFAVWLTGGDNNVFTQIGLIVLIGLAAKNAILIVEFVVKMREEGRTTVDAALQAARLRLRPILMTSITFIIAVFPRAVSTGAGAEMWRAMGVAVFSGMIGVTVFGLFLTPIFYVVLERLGVREVKATPDSQPIDGAVTPRPSHA